LNHHKATVLSMSTLSDVLDGVCDKLGVAPVKLVRVDRFRWYVFDRDGLGPQMIRIERMLQEVTGRPIDLRLEPMADKNKRFDRNYLRKVEKL